MQSGLKEKTSAKDQSAVNEADIKSAVVASAENDSGPLNGTLCWFGLWLWYSPFFFFFFFFFPFLSFYVHVFLVVVFIPSNYPSAYKNMDSRERERERDRDRDRDRDLTLMFS